MIKYNNSTKQIQITRGDTISFRISAKDEEGHSYIFEEGSILKFKVTEANNENVVVLEKDINIESQTTKVDIALSSEDTKIGCYINEPVIYWYEISLVHGNIVQTIIGYDKKGAKEFVLYPEALEVTNNG